MTSDQTYRRFAEYYDRYAGDFAADLPIYLSLCQQDQAILEIGCGTGRVLSAFLEAGYYIHGIDTSSEMLEIATQKLSGFLRTGALCLHYGDLRHYEFGGRPFDYVLVTWFTFNYLLGTDERLEFLQAIADAMRPGATLALDLFVPLSKRAPEHDGRWRESLVESANPPMRLRDKRELTADIEHRIQIYEDGAHAVEIETRRRFISESAMQALLEQTGFQAIRVTEDYDTTAWRVPGTTGAKAKSVMLIARRGSASARGVERGRHQ